MSSRDKAALQPRLRFPEFRAADGWYSTPLGELGEIVTGKTPSTTEVALWGGEILFITPTDIAESEKYQHTTQRTVVKTTRIKLLPLGSVVYTCIASIGKMALTVAPSVTNQQINAVVSNDRTAKEFIYYSLANLTPWIKSIPATSTLPIINKTQFSGFIIPHPENKAEQQKIANCLSSLDELIAAQARKVDALKIYKKGLMQQLFPREGETQPRLRFPEFRNSEGWGESTVGNLCKSFSGGTPSTSEKAFYDGNIPFIRSAEIARNRTELFLTHEGLKKSSAKLVAKGDVLVALYGANSGDVAIAKIDGAINQAILCLKSEQSNAFIFQLLKFKEDWITTTYLQGGQGNLSGEIVKSILVPLPNEAEQKSIANCLTSLDNFITVATQELDTLKTHKKGLMQQLFLSAQALEA